MNGCYVAFRVDLSLKIGAGHLMRCLTLADALHREGAVVKFVCRDLPDVFQRKILEKGHELFNLQTGYSQAQPVVEDMTSDALNHASWLSTSQLQDAEETAKALEDRFWDWLVVDHYALDERWEAVLRPRCQSLMIIDDLADRHHDCDMILDQTFGREIRDYQPLVPSDCRILCGSQYALLRPEFAELRHFSLLRRAHPRLSKLLITMGGVDKDNVTGEVLKALRVSPLPAHCQISVVMGEAAPWLEEVSTAARDSLCTARVLVGVTNMAQLMANSDLAIGAAGATSWERCCLGLPSVMLPLADNQIQSCRTLAETGAGLMISEPGQLLTQLPEVLFSLMANPSTLSRISETAAKITDGKGVERVVQFICSR